MSAGPFNLERFRQAQAPVIADVMAELAAGQKRSHWMWYVFPQIAGLGSSPMAEHYAIVSLDEARAYLADAVLGPRLIAAVEAILGHSGRSAEAILGSIDALKFRSCLTLFLAADPAQPALREALARFYDGHLDPATLERV
jgi:uncharacterized protein (DUF1810 family)